MGKKADDSVLDAPLDVIATATHMIALDAEPADRSEAQANALATTTMSAGDFTKANGNVSGRKLIISSKPGVAVAASGNINHIAFITTSKLLYVTTATTKAVVSPGTVDLQSLDIEVRDPS
ncbi:MAG: hypothetical protein AAF542_17890 [Pseudomonadota bacterium]